MVTAFVSQQQPAPFVKMPNAHLTRDEVIAALSVPYKVLGAQDHVAGVTGLVMPLSPERYVLDHKRSFVVTISLTAGAGLRKLEVLSEPLFWAVKDYQNGKCTIAQLQKIADQALGCPTDFYQGQATRLSWKVTQRGNLIQLQPSEAKTRYGIQVEQLLANGMVFYTNWAARRNGKLLN